MIQNGHDKHKSNNVDQKQDDSLAQIAQQHEIQMEQHGFVVHLVLPSEESGWANYHTHGLDISRNHLDFHLLVDVVDNKEIMLHDIYTIPFKLC